jgi:hypothetical protein
LLGKPWIEKDQIRRKAKEEATQKKNQELRDFIARKIDRLIEERENKSKKQNKVTMQEGVGTGADPGFNTSTVHHQNPNY